MVQVPGGRAAHILWGIGRLYVVGRSLPRIYQIDAGGNLTAIAGSGERGLEDGPALEATLSLPNDLALSPDGRILYFNDVATVDGDWRVISPTVVRLVRLVGN